MSQINYDDLRKIYHHEQLDLPEKKKKVRIRPQPQPQPQPIIIIQQPEPVKVEEKPHIREQVYMRTMFHDPLRSLVSFSLPFILGNWFSNFLGCGKNPERVGNQHITDMSKERVQELRRLGVLPPPKY